MTRVLLITKGHPFAKDDFEIFDELVKDTNSCVSDYTHVEQPAAQHFFHPENSRNGMCLSCTTCQELNSIDQKQREKIIQ